MSESLLDKAEQNFQVAKVIGKSLTSDDAYLNYQAYHLQQAVELAIKNRLESEGIEYPKAHDIDQLLSLADKNHVLLCVPDYIYEHSERFTIWESRTRYILDYRLQYNRVQEAMNYVSSFIQMEEISDEFRRYGLQNLEIQKYFEEGDKSPSGMLQMFADNYYIPNCMIELCEQYSIFYEPECEKNNEPEVNEDEFER